MSNKTTIYIEISDLINFIYHENRVTGIQRLVSQICWAFLNNNLKYDYKYCGILTESDNNFMEFDSKKIYKLIESIIKEYRGLVKIVDELRSESKLISCKDGDFMFGTGASFSFKNYIYSVRKLKMKSNIFYGSIVYDLIPYHLIGGLPIELPKVFSLWLSELPCVSDLLVSISKHTRRELSMFCSQRRISLKNTININIPLSNFPVRQLGEVDIFSRYNTGSKYCLFVSTMEVRKNHTSLLDAWEQLVKQYIDMEIPKLVFVGKQGYGFNDLIDRYNYSKVLKEKVVFIHDASDGDLEALYAGCIFTLYPSLYEGWGLPVTESLSRGKFCLASNSSSLPEAGGVFAEYFDPENASEIATLVANYLMNPHKLKERENKIKNEYVPRSWEEYVSDLEETIRKVIVNRSIGKNEQLPSKSGVLYQFKYDFLYGESFRNFIENRSIAYAMLYKGFWFVPESEARWSHHIISSIRLKVSSTKSQIVKCYIQYWLPVNLIGMNFSINVNSKNMLQINLTPNDFGMRMITFETAPTEDGHIVVDFVGTDKKRIEGNNEPRDLLLALLSVGYAESVDDSLKILEEINRMEFNKS